MNTETAKPGANSRFRVGDWVAYTSGRSRHVVEVIEDVGPVGARARRFYRLREPIWYGSPVEYELPEDLLEPASDDDLTKRYEPELLPPSPYDLPQAEYE